MAKYFNKQNPEAARAAGRKGGVNAPRGTRGFAQDNELASRVGKRGGKIGGKLGKRGYRLIDRDPPYYIYRHLETGELVEFLIK